MEFSVIYEFLENKWSMLNDFSNSTSVPLIFFQLSKHLGSFIQNKNPIFSYALLNGKVKIQLINIQGEQRQVNHPE